MNSYNEVAVASGLDGNQRIKFVKFMNKRFPGEENTICLMGQATKYAIIFKSGKEASYLSNDEKSILAELDAPTTVSKPTPKPAGKVARVVNKVANKVKEVAKKGKKGK